MAPTTLRAAVGGHSFRYVTAGEGERCVVYWHGYTGLDPWFPFLEELSKRFRVLAVELPGYGESQAPAWINTVDELAFYMVDVLAALGVNRPPVLIGSSFGGWLAAAYAAYAPTAVERLVLVDAMGLYHPDHPLPDVFLISEEEHMRLRYAHPDGDRLLEKESDFLEMARAQRATAHYAWNPRFHDPKLPYKLPRIQAPTLIIWGECDGVIPVVYAQKYQQAIANATLAVVPDSGHVPQFEQPAAFARALLPFVCEGEQP
ncbi:MAG: alpha/beta hydrolase [Alicyclobacillus sp.]|nr:alpha/beta hydrolase [Alicyclobacillus sp.]